MRHLKEFCSWVGTVFLGVLVVAYIFFFKTCNVSGSSMYPTFKNGDYLICRATDEIADGDIVAIYSDELKEILCKRVIATAGETVVIRGNEVTVNGIKVAEPYIAEEDWSYGCNVTVPDGHVYVMGDNRNASLDSRELGCLEVDDIVGVVIYNLTAHTGITSEVVKIVCFVIAFVLIGSFVIDAIQKRRKK